MELPACVGCASDFGHAELEARLVAREPMRMSGSVAAIGCSASGRAMNSPPSVTEGRSLRRASASRSCLRQACTRFAFRGSRTFRAGWCALLREPVARQALTIQALARAAGSSCRLVRFVSGTPARPDHAVSRDQPGQTSSLRSRNSSLNCQPSKVATIRPSSSQESSLPSTTTIGTP